MWRAQIFLLVVEDKVKQGFLKNITGEFNLQSQIRVHCLLCDIDAIYWAFICNYLTVLSYSTRRIPMVFTLTIWHWKMMAMPMECSCWTAMPWVRETYTLICHRRQPLCWSLGCYRNKNIQGQGKLDTMAFTHSSINSKFIKFSTAHIKCKILAVHGPLFSVTLLLLFPRVA